MRLIDSHCHLQAAPFAHDAAKVLASAHSVGVERVLVPGYDVASSKSARVLALGGEVDASAGIHPHVASAADDEAWAAIEDLARSPETIALGETGLDYDRMFSPREAQLTNLRRHLAMGRDLDKPVILHCRSKAGARDAQDDLLHELEIAGRPKALLHSFSGPVDYAERALEMGLSISFSGLVFKKGEETSAEVARLVPEDRLLVETDSPYLSPPGAPKRRNEPRWVSVTAAWLAQRRGADPDALGETLVANYDRVFSRARNSSRPSTSSR